MPRRFAGKSERSMLGWREEMAFILTLAEERRVAEIKEAD